MKELPEYDLHARVMRVDQVLDAVNNRAESFVLVSGDTDFIGLVNIVRKDYGKNVIVHNPHTRRPDLKQYASYYKDIPRDRKGRM